jgi:hypothetical protein
MMDDFEKQLAEALKRKDPSPGFEARVMAAARTRKTRTWSWSMPRLRWAAALAMTVLVIGGLEYRREAAERAAGEAAKARLELALKITSEKLKMIQDRVNSGE